jgi:CubicO group peptidase (beta-lactamase class C family)
MHMRLSIVLTILTSCFVGGTSAAQEHPRPFPKATPESQGLSAKDLDALAGVVIGFVKDERVVGAELLVIKNGRTVLHRGFGLKDKETKTEWTPDTICCVRSMTKPVIGVAVQMLIDDGKLGLDDPVAKHLPSFDNDKSRAITVRQLLSHKGGLKLSTLLSLGLKGVSNVRELVDRIGKDGPDLKPGEKFNYSDDGADTLTALVGVVAGMPAEQLLQERLFDPLGMRDTVAVFKKDDPRASRTATAYAGSKGTWTMFSKPSDAPLFTYFLGSQGLYSTTTDYARFLKMLAAGGAWGEKRILSKAAISRILTPTEDRTMSTGFEGRRGSYGQMMTLYRDTDGKVHAFGHGGSDGTHAYAFPDKDLFVLYYTQSRGNVSFLDFELALHRLFIEPGKGLAADKPVDPKAVAPLLGLYWFDAVKCPVPVLVRDGRLWIEFPFQAEIELKAADHADKWVARLNPTVAVEFKRDGTSPATGLTLRQPTVTHELPRLKKDDGLPSVDDLMKLRERTQGTAGLAKLGAVRIRGKLELITAKKTGSVEVLTDGLSRYRLEAKVGETTDLRVVDGEQVWAADGGQAPTALTGARAEQVRLNHPAFAAADWRPLFQEIQVLKKFDRAKKPHLLLWAVPREASPRVLVVEAETGRLVGDRHLEILPGIGRLGKEVRYADYKDVGGVQFPTRITHTYPTPLIGQMEHRYESFETNVKVPAGAFAAPGGK